MYQHINQRSEMILEHEKNESWNTSQTQKTSASPIWPDSSPSCTCAALTPGIIMDNRRMLYWSQRSSGIQSTRLHRLHQSLKQFWKACCNIIASRWCLGKLQSCHCRGLSGLTRSCLRNGSQLMCICNLWTCHVCQIWMMEERLRTPYREQWLRKPRFRSLVIVRCREDTRIDWSLGCDIVDRKECTDEYRLWSEFNM